MTTNIKRVGILAHPQRPQTAPVAEEIAHYLESRAVRTCVHTHWEESDVVQDVQATEMVIAIGGDGAMLRAARVCAPFGVPVLGINMGQLGFLTEISGANNWQPSLETVLRGEYWIESRMMLYAALVRGDVTLVSGDALNDVVISRGIAARTIRLETYIDKDWTTTYNADALIIATATGSTAYALACGGPILPPELRNILIVPVAPHLSMDRPIVLAEGSTVDVISTPDNLNEIVLTVDGTMLGEVLPGDTIRIQASQHISRFIRLREKNYFYRSLLDRLEPRQPVRSRPDKKQL